ncbi:MAG: hypothetical protein WCQ00_01065 [bacterium]
MNATPNDNIIPDDVGGISNLHGEELENYLKQKLDEFNEKIDASEAALEKMNDYVESGTLIDEQKTYDEDTDDILEIEDQLDTDLNNAVLDLATEDRVLKDIE